MRAWVRLIRAGTVNPDALVLAAVDADAEEELEKLPRGEQLRADVVKPRNSGLHRKAFALLKVVLPHTNYPNIERLRAAMTIGAGWVDDVIEPYTGNVMWIPRSWAFDSMDDLEFREFYNALINVALKIVPNSSKQDWEDAVDHIVRM